MRDDDQRPNAAAEAAFVGSGGTVIAWRDGRCLEQELFWSLPAEAVREAIGRAVDLMGEELVDDQIKWPRATRMTMKRSLLSAEAERWGQNIG